MKLKLIVLLLIASCVTQLHAQNSQESATTILDNAYKQAKLENKNVFVMFHASWCGWCKKMDQQMTSDACKAFFDDNYVTKHLTVFESKQNKHLENPGALEFLTEHKGEQAGLPFWLILDADGNLLADSFNNQGENIGCPGLPEEVTSFIEKLKKTSSLHTKELNIIAATFGK